MVWPILISLSVTPGAFCAAADIAIAPLSSKQPNKIRNTARSRSRTAGCCALTASGQPAAAPPTPLMKFHRFIPSPRRQSGGRGREGRWPHASALPLALFHLTVLGGAGELLALRAHRLWRACFPFTFFQEAVERSAGQWLAILVDCFACAGFLRHGRADRQGGNDGSEDNPLHGTSSRWCTCPLYQQLLLLTPATTP